MENIKIEKEIFKWINDNLVENRKVIKPKRKQKSFEEYYNQLDYNIQCRYDYIYSQLCSVDDEILKLFREIEELKIEIGIENEIGSDPREDVAFDIENESLEDRLEYLENVLEYLEGRYEVLEDLHEDMYLKIIA